MTANSDDIAKAPEEIVYPEKMKMIRRIDGLEPGEHSYVIDSEELCRILQESGPIPVGVHNYPHPDNDDLVSVEFKLGMEISRAILTLFATRELAKRNEG
jgi:hypothetical protein